MHACGLQYKIELPLLHPRVDGSPKKHRYCCRATVAHRYARPQPLPTRMAWACVWRLPRIPLQCAGHPFRLAFHPALARDRPTTQWGNIFPEFPFASTSSAPSQNGWRDNTRCLRLSPAMRRLTGSFSLCSPIGKTSCFWNEVRHTRETIFTRFKKPGGLQGCQLTKRRPLRCSKKSKPANSLTS